jgi:hypothetical protein
LSLATYTINRGQEDAITKVLDFTENKGVDVAIAARDKALKVILTNEQV